MQKQKLKNVYFYTSTVFCIILIFHILWSSLGNLFGAAIFNFIPRNIKTGLDICACVFLPLNTILYATVYRNEVFMFAKISMIVATTFSYFVPITTPLLHSEHWNGDIILLVLIHEFCIPLIMLAVIAVLIISAIKYPKYDISKRTVEKKIYFFVSAVFCSLLMIYLSGLAVADILPSFESILNVCTCLFLPLNAVVYMVSYRNELSENAKIMLFISSILSYFIILTRPMFDAVRHTNFIIETLPILHMISVIRLCCIPVFLISVIFLITAMIKYHKLSDIH